MFDIYGNETYFDAYNRALDNKMCFVEAFYTPYDIPYSVRTDWFEVTRDHEREALVYEVFIQKYGEEYGLSHLLEVDSSLYPIIELDKISDYFFDMALVLDHSKEIHVIDSVWAAVIYHLQAKYVHLFQCIFHVNADIMQCLPHRSNIQTGFGYRTL